MGRKGGISSQSVNVIIRRLKSCKIKHLTVDSAVDYLRSNYPDSSRDKVQKLTYLVHKSLDIINKSKPSLSPSKTPKRFQFNGGEEEEEEDDSDGAVRTPALKKPRKSNFAEEKLIRIENERIRKYNANQETSSTCDDDDDGEEEGTVSTSEDAIYGEEMKPEFDLMKSMLRANYSGMKPTANLEQEVEVGEKPSRKLMNMNVNASAGANLIQGGGGGERGKESSLGGVEEKGKEYEGPTFKDLGGMDAVLDDLMMDVLVPLYHPQLPLYLGVKPIAGILLHGPPGCGKTMLAHAIANETGVPFYKISATDVVSGVSGASEENIRDLFSKAYRTAPSIVFIDEIDSIASKRENLQREMERRIVTQLMICMDESNRLLIPNDVNSKSENSDRRPGFVLVIGATNRPDAMDPALRRPGRFDREIVLGAPDENARAKILSVITRSLRLEGSFDLLNLARGTPGFVGADLAALANKAGNLAMRRIIEKKKYELLRELPADQTNEWHKHPSLHDDLDTLSITMADFEEAAKLVQPSLRREGFSTIPNVKWEDVGGLDSLREVFDRYIVRRIKYPENFEEFGINLETGFLLYGPPGCGKTLIAKAVANEAGANFIHVKGPELLNKYVGESELAVRTIFTRARTCSPCIIFFDEMDALTTQRGTEGGRVVESLLTQLLTELDGGDERRGVFVIGATNRPEVIDGALLRSGRFGERLYVPLPKPEERGLILKAIGRNMPIDDDADLISIGRNEACANLSGADLYKLMNEAAMVAFDEKYASTLNGSGASPPRSTIKLRHFEQVMKNISPSVSDKQVQYYQRLSESFKAA